MNAEQKQHAIALVKAWDKTAYGMHADAMAAMLQELVDAPEPEPVARVTGYYAGYLSIETVDGRVLSTGTALYTAPPAPSVPDMPLSMEQFGGLVGLARDDASEKAIVYKATNIYGETCYFGVKSTAQAWAKSGRVDEVRLRELRVVATPPAPSVPDEWRSAIAKEFPLYDEDGLDKDKHCCEWVMLQERKRLHKMLAEAVAAEREACAKICESVWDAWDAANEIRARGEKGQT